MLRHPRERLSSIAEVLIQQAVKNMAIKDE